MKSLEMSKMEVTEGGRLTACDVVGSAWASGIGFVVGAVNPLAGLGVGFVLSLVATEVCSHQ